MIRNPILPGFNPDPSICRVGQDYYIATSTFEWYPGVQIHHSRNLTDWRLVARPLCRASQLDMRGNPDSCGIWAPCLSYSDERFWLVYTDVKRFDGNFKDAHNYIVTAVDPLGPWSERQHVNSSGFDPSLFHDTDGRRWFLNLVWNHRADSPGPSPRLSPRLSPFGGIALQEYDAEEGRLIGDSSIIFTESARGLAEGAHLFKRDGWYYLVVAEGGTGYEHAVTHARSRHIGGPYALHPDTHVITADPAKAGDLQRAGHGQPVETPEGEWYHTHLCTRPLDVTRVAGRRSRLGRETALQKCHWGDDGWLRLVHGTPEPAVQVEAPATVAGSAAAESGAALHSQCGQSAEQTLALAGSPVNDEERHDDFSGDRLPIDFQWLRTPEPERLFSLTARPGFLRLYGRESVGSLFEQSLIARRQQHLSFQADTVVEYEPTCFQQCAGLVAYYDRHRFHFLNIGFDEEAGRILSIMSCAGDWPNARLSWPLDDSPSGAVTPMPLPSDSGPISLRCRIDGADLRFAWRAEGSVWQDVGPLLDASLLSDEAGRGEHASFTGAFIGMLAMDLSGAGRYADFASFHYQPST